MALGRSFLKRAVEIGIFRVPTQFNYDGGHYHFVGGSPVGVSSGSVGFLNPTLDRYWGLTQDVFVVGSVSPIGIAYQPFSGFWEPFVTSEYATVYSLVGFFELTISDSEPAPVFVGEPVVGGYLRPTTYAASDGKVYAVWAIEAPSDEDIYLYYGRVESVSEDKRTILAWFTPAMVSISYPDWEVESVEIEAGGQVALGTIFNTESWSRLSADSLYFKVGTGSNIEFVGEDFTSPIGGTSGDYLVDLEGKILYATDYFRNNDSDNAGTLDIVRITNIRNKE